MDRFGGPRLNKTKPGRRRSEWIVKNRRDEAGTVRRVSDSIGVIRNEVDRSDKTRQARTGKIWIVMDRRGV